MGLVIALIVLILILGAVVWFVVNRATTGKGGEHGGSTPEISDANTSGPGTPEGETPARPQPAREDSPDVAKPVIGGEGEGQRSV
jgi:hypothetical protein